jgi:hypothetical protein
MVCPLRQLRRCGPLALLASCAGSGGAAGEACPSLPTPAAAAREAVALFRGTVLELKDTTTLDTRTGAREPALAAALRAEAGWKGFADTVAVVLTPAPPSPQAARGVRFRAGERYLVYATGTSAHLRASACLRTRPLAEAGEDALALGPPRWRRDRPRPGPAVP